MHVHAWFHMINMHERFPSRGSSSLRGSLLLLLLLLTHLCQGAAFSLATLLRLKSLFLSHGHAKGTEL